MGGRGCVEAGGRSTRGNEGEGIGDGSRCVPVQWGSTDVVTPLVVLTILAGVVAQYVPPRVGHLFEWRVSQLPPVVQGLGFALVEPFKIDLTIIAAILTIIGYSINDTIVIFDRMREIKGKSPDLTPKMINDAVNQTLSRSIITSLTVLIVVVILYIWGGEAMHGFAFALLVGVISGTYSTIYIAAPLALWMGNKGEKKPAAAARVTQASQPKALR